MSPKNFLTLDRLLDDALPVVAETMSPRGRLQRILAFAVSIIPHRWSRLHRENFRWRSRALFTRLVSLVAIFLELSKKFQKSGKAIDVHWPPAGTRTFGELFGLIALVELLTISGYRVNFRLSKSPESGTKFNQLPLESQLRLQAGWKLMIATFLGPNPLVKIDLELPLAHSAPKQKSRSLLETIISRSYNYITSTTTMLFRVSTATKRDAFKNHYQKYRMGDAELAEHGLPRDFITWNVRQNLEYGLMRNPNDVEIISDFRKLCEVQPYPIVVLTEPHGKNHIESLLRVELRSIDAATDRLFFAPTDSYISLLRVIWAGKGHYQRRGGGTGMAAIFSTLPYIIIFPGPDLTGNFVLGTSGALAPWSRRGAQRGILETQSIEPPRSEFEEVFGALR